MRLSSNPNSMLTAQQKQQLQQGYELVLEGDRLCTTSPPDFKLAAQKYQAAGKLGVLVGNFNLAQLIRLGLAVLERPEGFYVDDQSAALVTYWKAIGGLSKPQDYDKPVDVGQPASLTLAPLRLLQDIPGGPIPNVGYKRRVWFWETWL